MNQQKPIFKCSYFGSWVEVYPTRVEYGLFSKRLGYKTIMINQIASVESGMMGLMKIIVETTGGRKYEIPTNKKNELKNAIYQAME